MKPGKILRPNKVNKLEKEDLYNKNYYSRGVGNMSDNPVIKLIENLDFSHLKNNFRKGGLILEIGCGEGKISRWLSSYGFKVDAIDISKEAIKIAKKQKSKVNFIYGDIFGLKRKGNYYNAVFSLHVMEHIKNIDETLKEICRILRSDGKLIIRIPNSDSLEAGMAGKNWFHWDEKYHVNHWKYGEFKSLLLKAGFKKVTVNFKVLEYKQVLLYSFLNKLGINTDNSKTRSRLLPFQIIFVPLSIMLGFLFKNSGTVEFIATKN